ncbi:MAG: hemolysin family protein [Saprospiraceae bacterium]
MTLLIAFFLVSIIFSFLCSVWESVLLSITPSYIKRKEQDDPPTGKLISKLKADIDKPLSAILTLNTIAHTVGAIGVGAQAGEVFGDHTVTIYGFELSYESIIAALMTLAILYLSEIIPKTIGANNWKSLAPVTARSINILVLVLRPFVWLSNRLTKLLKKDKEKSVFSKQDFAAMADVVSESGEIDQSDYELIKNVLRFDDLQARDIMTPRTVMVMASEDETLEEFYSKNKPFRFSRIPLYKESRDSVSGVLLKDDLLQAMIDGNRKTHLKDIQRELTLIPETMNVRKLFSLLTDKRAHMAVVVDEYGGLSGLVTIEDIIETLMGMEIMDETDSVSDLQAFARKKWEERAKKLGLIE